MSNVRSILQQPLYRGFARWNRLKQHDEDGNPILEINPDADHITQFDPAWRIVPEDISDDVDARFVDADRQQFRSKPGAKARYLLSGGRDADLTRSCGPQGSPRTTLHRMEAEAARLLREARYLVRQLLGPIELWHGRAEDLAVYVAPTWPTGAARRASNFPTWD